MPIINSDSYRPSFFLRNAHINTAYRTAIRSVVVAYNRIRITTRDNDFMDLDFSTVGSKEIVVIIHGLEGSSQSSYVLALTKLLNKNKYDVCALNLRGCSGFDNNLLCSYHSGKTDDLDFVLRYIRKNLTYKKAHLAGYSLGGNIVLKYMGEYAQTMPAFVKSAYSVSPPCDLEGSSFELGRRSRRPYMQIFLRSLKQKLLLRYEKFPGSFLDKKKILSAKNFYDIDNLYTAPAHGFKDAHDYWKKSSSNRFLSNITKPTLLITSHDDPFLSQSCIPTELAKRSKFVYLVSTNHGGHVGFVESLSLQKIMWSEKSILEFLRTQ